MTLLQNLRQVFEDWDHELSFLRVFAAIELCAASFGLIWSIINKIPEGIIACSGLITALFAAKWLQSKVEAQADEDEKKS